MHYITGRKTYVAIGLNKFKCKNIQECITVGYVPPALYHTGGGYPFGEEGELSVQVI